ncbi:MAG TPA: heparan-alpha-glucosaminide N-acetyltransferase domain-containing protein, partial [Steroidobacteraceae bacterium]
MNAVNAAPIAIASGELSAAPVRSRIQSVDILRGLVMIIMALDHVRDFLHSDAQHFDPADLSQTTPVLFFTRWITHFCAPTFMFLAGTGAYLQSRRAESLTVVARFLWTRGLWLVVLELTWVRWLGWNMNFSNDQIFLWVIWALGVSM